MFARFETLIDSYPVDDRNTPPNRMLPFVVHYARPMLPLLVMSAVLVALISVIEIVFFNLVGVLVDWLAASEREGFLDRHGWMLAGGGLLILVGYPALALVHGLVTFQGIFGTFPMRVRWLAHRYILRQSMSFFQDEFAGRISQKVMQTSLAVRDALMTLIDACAYAAVYFFGAAFVVGQLDPIMTAPLVFWLFGYAFLLRYFIPRLQQVAMEQSDARAEMTGRVVDSYTNIQTIKLFAHTSREHDYARDAMDGFLGTVHVQMRLVTKLVVGLHIMNSALFVGMVGVSIYAWQSATITVGAIAVALGLTLRIRNMSHWIMWEVAQLFEHIGTIADGVGTISHPVAITDRSSSNELQVTRGEIAFDAAHFQYGQTTRVLRDFSLTIRPGEKVGLVGRSGAGKSTLVNLLMRFYDLESGRILIDGQDISGVTQDSLRRQIGMVTQDTSLLHRSVRDNILYGRPDAGEEAMLQATEMANADEFIANLADAKGREGYDAHVGERGVKLSGGQRQRIAIARVFLKDAPILVLDEATSALDSEVEAEIQQSLYRLMEGKTVIAIAHRLSTIAAMDRLVVLDNGEIVEVGTHDELLRHKGLYASLWSRQSGGFLDLEPENPVEA